jgi:transposase
MKHKDGSKKPSYNCQVAVIVQLFISLMRYEFEEIKHKSTKFIKKSLKNLALTIKFVKNGIRNHIFANFDKINSLIVTKLGTIP